MKGCSVAVLMAAALAGLGSAQVRAESGVGGGFGPDGFSANTTDDVGQYLGPVYKNELAGFEIAPPVGSRVINRAGVDLVSFVNDAKQWGGSVQMASLVKKTGGAASGGQPNGSGSQQVLTFDEYMASIGPELSKSFRAVQVLNTRELKFQGHQAGRIDTSMEAEVGGQGKSRNAPGEVISLYRQQLIVRVTDNDLMVLTMYTPLKDRDAATTTFEAMLTSYQLLDRTEIAKQLQISVKAGKEWLAQRTADELKGKLNNQPQLFRMKVGGVDQGYLRFDEKQDTRNHLSGILISINTRGFPQDGSIIYGQNEAFWAFAGDAPADRRPYYSMWANTTKKVGTNPNVARASQTLWLSEFGLVQLQGLAPYSDEELAAMQKHREEIIRGNEELKPGEKPKAVPPPIDVPKKEYRIQVTYSADPSQPPMQGLDGAISADRPSPLPTVLEFLWPRVVDLSKPTQMTFVSFNSALHKLTYRKLSVVGPDHIAIDRKPVDCVRCTDEMEPNITTLWVDPEGKILLMRASDQSLLAPTTEDEMARLWAGKLKQQ